MNGRELYEHLQSLRPDLPVLFMSGYTPDAVNERGMGGRPMPLLQKPFTPNDLAAQVRKILDGD